jgi:hypothetical protein
MAELGIPNSSSSTGREPLLDPDTLDAIKEAIKSSVDAGLEVYWRASKPFGKPWKLIVVPSKSSKKTMQTRPLASKEFGA